MLTESKTVELKREYVEDIKKKVVAFANSEGGTIYIGINDDGSVCGVSDADSTMLRVTKCHSRRGPSANSLLLSGLPLFFKKRGLEFGRQQMRTLHLIGKDGTFTNLAFLLSEQCAHTIELAVFEGSKKTVFKDRTELSGSLLEQLDPISTMRRKIITA